MNTDRPLKLLFQNCAADLLPLTGDVGAVVQYAGPAELRALERRVDCVLQLEKDGEVYYRHLEFQSRPDPNMAVRCFRYNTQLVLQHGAAVLTTVLYLEPPKPRQRPVFRVLLGGREINRWRFEQVCLWELEAQGTLAHAAPGLLALVPQMRGGRRLDVIQEAWERIRGAAPEERLSTAEEVLLVLAGQYYTVSELARFVGRERMIQSSLYTEGRTEGRVEGRVEGRTEGRAEGRVEGRVEGRLEGERELCVALARKHHPGVLDRATPVIESCQDAARLKKWALAASDVNDDEFLKLLGA